MKTRLPISTISYNTPAFLAVKLAELKKAKVLSEWYFIEHKPEDDEGGLKVHIHLYAVPAKSIQTEDLVEELIEPDMTKLDKPRKCLAFRTSKNFADWYLYAIHDPAYLASKGESRRYNYTRESIQASDDDELNRRIHEINLLEKSPYAKLMAYAQDGLTWQEVFTRGAVPIQQINQWKEAYRLILAQHTNRGTHRGHETENAQEGHEGRVLVDQETGEVLDDET